MERANFFTGSEFHKIPTGSQEPWGIHTDGGAPRGGLSQGIENGAGKDARFIVA
jgi:hypothetical protein